jgi:hypothetical protein
MDTHSGGLVEAPAACPRLPDADAARPCNPVTSALQAAAAIGHGLRTAGLGYPSGMGYSQDELELIDRTEEVEIETSSAEGAVHRTIVWAVVDDDAVFVRSYRGPGARWYREALANPDVALHVGGQRLPARAVQAPDPTSVERTSAGFLRKYAGDPATRSMVRPEVLDLTFRLEPR